jgi:hypothetical protein
MSAKQQLTIALTLRNLVDRMRASNCLGKNTTMHDVRRLMHAVPGDMLIDVLELDGIIDGASLKRIDLATVIMTTGQRAA